MTSGKIGRLIETESDSSSSSSSSSDSGGGGGGGRGVARGGPGGPRPPREQRKKLSVSCRSTKYGCVYIQKRLNIFVCIPNGAGAEGEGWGV